MVEPSVPSFRWEGLWLIASSGSVVDSPSAEYERKTSVQEFLLVQYFIPNCLSNF
jgi:hypothetical protein